jgi:hypothetical protein
MYISILESDLNTDPWFAVQWNHNLQSLLNNDEYQAGVNREFNRDNDNDVFIQTKSITESGTFGSRATAHVYQVANTHALTEITVAAIKKKKKPAKKTETKKSASKKAASKKAAPKKAAPKKSANKRGSQKVGGKQTTQKKSAKKSVNKPSDKKNK